jgi:hypothetical protein
MTRTTEVPTNSAARVTSNRSNLNLKLAFPRATDTAGGYQELLFAQR